MSEAKPTEAKPTEAKPTEAKPTEAKPNEAALAETLVETPKIGEQVRAATGDYVELDRLAWIAVLKKARPGNDVLKIRLAELLDGAEKATAAKVVVGRKNAVVMCQLASV